MSGIRFPSDLAEELRSYLFEDLTVETCAVAYANGVDGTGAWVVTSVAKVPEWGYERRTAVSAVLTGRYLVEIANTARLGRLSVVIIHTHPWAKGYPDFSIVDDEGETELLEYFGRRVPNSRHLAMVVGPEGCCARLLGAKTKIPVWEAGDRLFLWSPSGDARPEQRHDRQIRAFGELGQRIIAGLRIGVIGAGGTGSLVIQQLAHLGAKNFTIIDPDVVERTNLNRLVGASFADLEVPKVFVARNLIHGIDPDAQVEALQRDVIEEDVAAMLKSLDFVFLCTDSHASRAVVNQIAYQYLVPAIDMGVSITVKDGQISHLTGRTQMLSAGLPCLVCTQALDGEQIRQELMTPEQRAADPYVIGAHEPQPAVISLNSTVASLAITMFLGAVTPAPAGARLQLYDGIRGTVRPTVARQVPNCLACSPSGALAKGDRRTLPVRRKRNL
ncbi:MULTISPECIES: HesA/MoeB/ThiF family protein [Rhizobium]|uniref:HesA/MoeB/ThiF family protein n=1 Tax=Rhizobium TaxID=379 RepID=UPI0007E56100|nr:MULTISPECIES: ThiF family adenylyltransferase [Rhizobium]MBY3129804.1 ThiF family adenylyltransferase [Rhizobium laguerreae]